MDSFWQRVEKTDSCWLWTGPITEGYGHLSVRGRHKYAHRLSWELSNGEIPKGLCVLHRCDNRPCVNPEHLFLGTKRDNTEDMLRKGRNAFGIRNPQAKLTDADVIAIRSSGESNRVTGARFGVSSSVVSQIRLRRAWRHVEAHPRENCA